MSGKTLHLCLHLLSHKVGLLWFTACGKNLLDRDRIITNRSLVDCGQCLRVMHQMTPEQKRQKQAIYDRKYRYKDGPPRRRTLPPSRIWISIDQATYVAEIMAKVKTGKALQVEECIRKSLAQHARKVDATVRD